MYWIYLIVAGLFEVGFTTCLKESAGFTRLWWTAGFLVCAVASLVLLNLAVEVIPLGTAYAVWTGIGAAGTTVVGMAVFGERVSRMRIALIVALVAAVAGLKLVSAA